MALSAAIFDVDGVLVASPHERAWREALTGFADPAGFTTAFYQANVAGKQRLERVYAVQGNLNTHSAPDVLLFNLLHPRWEFVFQPKYAAYLNLIEPW